MKPTLLAIDDEPDILEGIVEALKDDFTVLKAEDGQQGLSILARQDVSVILLDYIMPQENGLQILQKIKDIDPSIEVIMVTALKDDPTTAFELAKSGAFSYLTI